MSTEDATVKMENDAKQRRELFKDCALVEIIHLHDCLRGSLKALEHDVQELSKAVHSGSDEQQRLLEKKVAGRFKVIWSVFRAHSSAEDEFIWPALQRKTQGRIQGHKHHKEKDTNNMIEQEEYEEDHADEERMFSEMDRLLTQLREHLLKPDVTTLPPHLRTDTITVAIAQHTSALSQHLMHHLEKEETQCMPLVAQHLSKNEIHELVGQIMGKRSADTIAQIMTMAVQSLEETDRLEMVKYMKQAMSGTFFDRWLLMSGWMSQDTPNADILLNSRPEQQSLCNELSIENQDTKNSIHQNQKRPADDTSECSDMKRARVVPLEDELVEEGNSGGWTSPDELEKFIRAIATNPALTPAQKNSTIQGLRDSVWKSNKKHRRLHSVAPTVVNSTTNFHQPHFPSSDAGRASLVTTSSTRRVTPPSIYFKKNKAGKVELIVTNASTESPMPLFSASEMAPSYHDGAAASVLGCPHYARVCKLRHAKSGRLYTCRLCCEQQRELSSGDPDEPLDRYAVTEVLCMTCHALQPAEDRCINAECESRGKPFARYFCRICHLYDDAANKNIFHCPYCNCCRLGKGLGIDFRHCMRCNACVALSDDEHQCIPQKLQGSCPICHESLFQSTEPLRGLKCGHVMHMSCFTEYRRGHSYTCPLCMRSMDDMKDYFAMLDAAVRMQPMPTAYLTTKSNIYCQDCGKTGQVQYHFVGLKCFDCGSYNTREMGRVDCSDDPRPSV